MSAERPREILGRNIRKWREERGLSQRQLAARMTEHDYKWSPTTVADLEKSQRGLGTDELFALGLILAVSPQALFVADAPVRISSQIVVDDPGMFNLWLTGRARLWADGGELLVISRPKDILTTKELVEKRPDLFVDDKSRESER